MVGFCNHLTPNIASERLQFRAAVRKLGETVSEGSGRERMTFILCHKLSVLYNF